MFVKFDNFFLMVSLIFVTACANKYSNLNDGNFLIKRKFLFPRYEYVLPPIDISNSSIHEYKVSNLQNQSSIIGFYIERPNNECVSKYSEFIKCMILPSDTFKGVELKIMLRDTKGNVIAEVDSKLDKLIWSCSLENTQKWESNICHVYTMNAYFVPKKKSQYFWLYVKCSG